MRRIVIIVVCFLFSSPEAAAYVPFCADNKLSPAAWVRKHLESADTVFLGVVISVASPPSAEVEKTEPPVANSMAELLKAIEAGQERNVQIASFEVLKSWKGAEFPVVRTKSRNVPGEYGFPFTVGESYLIFGRDFEDGFYWVWTVCNMTLRAAKAAERIEILNELTSVP